MPWYVVEIDTVMVSMGKDAAPSRHVVFGSEDVLPHDFSRQSYRFITYIGMCSPVDNFLFTETAAIVPVIRRAHA